MCFTFRPCWEVRSKFPPQWKGMRDSRSDNAGAMAKQSKLIRMDNKT